MIRPRPVYANKKGQIYLAVYTENIHNQHNQDQVFHGL